MPGIPWSEKPVYLTHAPGAKKYDAMLRVGEGHGRVTEVPYTYMVNYHCCCWDHFPAYTLSVDSNAVLTQYGDCIWLENVQQGFNLFREMPDGFNISSFLKE